MVMDLIARRRARTWIALAAALALLVAALVPKVQGHGINRAMLFLSILFLAISRISRRRTS